MQLMQESKSVSQNAILVVDSLPSFINTSVSLAVFNAMLKGYPKKLYWFSNNVAIINFLKISNITSIWKPPIVNEPMKKNEQLSTNVSQFQPNRTTGDIKVENPNPVNSQNEQQQPSKIVNIDINKSSKNANTSISGMVQTATSSQFKMGEQSNIKPVNISEIPKEINPKNSSILQSAANNVKQNLSRNIALLPKLKSVTNNDLADKKSLETDLKNITPPDFNNLNDLIDKIETTKQALEKKHNKLNKNMLDTEISIDAKSSLSWLMVLGASILFLVIAIGIFLFLKR
jgi:hypothetical protein